MRSSSASGIPGVGITPEQLSSVFEPFVQGDRSLERSAGGLGIGLTLVRKLTELHGGTVMARSDGPGKGSEFTVRLPAASETVSQQSSPQSKPEPTTRRPARVLVVDDNEDLARGLGETSRDSRSSRADRLRWARRGRQGKRVAPGIRAPGYWPARHGRLSGRGPSAAG